MKRNIANKNSFLNKEGHFALKIKTHHRYTKHKVKIKTFQVLKVMERVLLWIAEAIVPFALSAQISKSLNEEACALVQPSCLNPKGELNLIVGN